MSEPTPQQVAEFDQALALSQEMLTQLTAAYVRRRRLDMAEDLPESVSVMGLASTLVDGYAHDDLAAMLTVAVLVILGGAVNDGTLGDV